MARDAGAKAVYFASAAPPVKFPNVYGIDMPTKAELIASSLSEDEIAAEIGADRIVYQDLDDLRAAILEEAKEAGSVLTGLDCSCFDGEYVTSDIGQEYLSNLANDRSADREVRHLSTPAHHLDRLDITAAGPPCAASPTLKEKRPGTPAGAPGASSPPHSAKCAD